MNDPARDERPKPFRRQRRCRRLLACVIIAAGLFSVFHWVIPLLYSLPEELETWQPPGITVTDRNGLALAHLPSPNHERGGHTPLSLIPQELVDATLAAEDKRFFSHSGIDYLALTRAVRQNITEGRTKSGASTITQQVIKLYSEKQPRTLATKFHEYMKARKLEMTHGKEWILSRYFDKLDYGNLNIGPAAAAEFYFGKRLDSLSLGQMAALAGLPQSPTRLNPLKNTQKSISRRNWILSRMEQEFGTDPLRIGRAKTEPLDLVSGKTLPPLAPHLMSKIFRSGQTGGEVPTTLDAPLQEAAEQAVRETLAGLEDKNAGQAAVIVIHNPSGDILVWVGSANRDDPRGGLIDGALTPRSAGSTLKPFVYALAFSNGHWAGEIIPDIPVTFRGKSGHDAPRNYSNTYRGPLSIRESLACSQNIPAMTTLNESGGPARLIPLLEKLGFTTLDRNPSLYGLGLAIGNAEVTLMELTNAYATLARKGTTFPVRWQKNTPSAGRQPEAMLSPEICFVLTDILSDDEARAEAFGTDSPLNFPFPCAVKTGTSSDYRDNWCIGFTKDITVGVWVGNFDSSPMREVSGVTGAGPVFHAVMEAAHKQYPSSFDPPPNGVTQVKIDKRTGFRTYTDGPGIPVRFTATEWAFNSSLPRTASPSDYDAEGRAMLDGRYTEWFNSRGNNSRSMYALDAKRWFGGTPKITSPPDKSTIAIDPELPRQGKYVRLESNLPEGTSWSCETLRIIDDQGHPAAELTPGTHTIKARHEALGLECETTVTVRQL